MGCATIPERAHSTVDAPSGRRAPVQHGSRHASFTSTAEGHAASGTAPVRAAFAGAPLRFQAGDYQQADSAGGGAGDDGARLTFHALTIGP